MLSAIPLVNLIDDPTLSNVVAGLRAIEREFPATDTSPRYIPLPPQTWDVVQKNPGRVTDLKGLPSNESRRGVGRTRKQ